MIEDKIKSRPELIAALESERASGKTIGFTNGCFDILHVGHARYLREAKDQCDVLVVGVNSDSSVRRLKGPDRPVNGENARMYVLASLGCIDYVSVFAEDTPEELIKSITPDLLFKGSDWSEQDVVGGDHVKEHGGKVKLITFVDGFSTTAIINKMKRGNG